MTNTQLQDIYYYAWDTFYKNRPQELKMGDLFMKVIHREIADGTYKSSPKPKDYVRHTRQR